MSRAARGFGARVVAELLGIPAGDSVSRGVRRAVYVAAAVALTVLAAVGGFWLAFAIVSAATSGGGQGG